MRLLFLAVILIVTSAAPAAAQNRAVLCRLLPVKHDAVGADYVPGVDVNGKPVVPADVNTPVKPFVDVVRFPVTVDLAQQLNQQLPPGTELDAPVAMIEIHKDGRVLYNGQELSEEVYDLCAKELVVSKEAVEEPQAIAPEDPPVIEQHTAPTQAQQSEQEEIIWGEGY